MKCCLWVYYRLLDSSVPGILEARILEQVAISFSRWSSGPRDQTRVSCIAGRLFTIWDTREAWNVVWYNKKKIDVSIDVPCDFSHEEREDKEREEQNVKCLLPRWMLGCYFILIWSKESKYRNRFINKYHIGYRNVFMLRYSYNTEPKWWMSIETESK